MKFFWFILWPPKVQILVSFLNWSGSYTYLQYLQRYGVWKWPNHGVNKGNPKKKKWCAILMLSISIADSYRLLTASKRNIGSNKTATILSQSMGVKITSNMGFVFTLDYGIWVRFLCLETMMWATYPCPLTTTIHTNSTTTWMIWYT